MTETRSRLLEAGVDLLHELGIHPGVTHVRLTEVAHRAGYSTSAAYRCWETQADFHRDLAIAALEWHDRALIADTTRMVRTIISAHAPWLEVLRVGGNSNVERTPAEVEFYIALAIRAASGCDPEVGLAADRRVTEGLDAHGELYSVLLEVYGREMRPPYTIDHLAAVGRVTRSSVQALGRNAQMLKPGPVGESQILTEEERKVIDWVTAQYGDLAPTKISALSHREKAYASTRPGEQIAYEYAKFFEKLPN